MNEPIQPDKEDRYLSEKKASRSSAAQPKSFLTKILTKINLIILIIICLIIILLLCFVLFNSNKYKSKLADDEPQKVVCRDVNDSDDTYARLAPSQISTDPTNSRIETLSGTERIEVSDDTVTSFTQENPNAKENKKFYELTLEKTIEDSHFTIQIAAVSSLPNLMAYVKTNNLNNYQIYETQRDGKPWFILIKGNYLTRDDAKIAIKHLPKKVQENSPWIKSGSMVNKEKRST